MKIPKSISDKIYWIGMICVVLACMLPVYVYAYYTVPLADDFSMTSSCHRVWGLTGDVFCVLIAAFKRMSDCYMTWAGDYVCMFLQTIPVGLGDYRLYFLSAWIIISCYIFAIYYVGKIFLLDYLHAEKKQWFGISTIILIFMLQFLPDLYDAFYWYTTAIAYTLSLIVKIVLVASIFKQLFILEKNNKSSSVILIIMSFLAAGFECSFTQTSYFLTITAFLVYCLFVKRKQVLASICWIAATVGWVVALFAPGNMVRQSENYGVTTGVISVIWEALNRGLISVSENIDFPLVLVTLILVPAIFKVVRLSGRKYCLPGLVTLFSIGVYSSTYAPWIFSRGVTSTNPFGGDSGYVTNVFWMLFVILWFFNIVYWMGWICNNLIERIKSHENVKKTHLKASWYGVLIALLLFWSMRLEHIMEYASPRLLWHIVNGNAQNYYSAMLEREDILQEGADGMLVVPKIKMPINSGGAGDITSDASNWVNIEVQGYYDLEYGVRTEE